MWIYDGNPFEPTIEELSEYYGFVYLITHRESGRRYVGKKFFWFKRGKHYVESDWKSYYGSCNQLNEERKEIGDDSYDREILHLCLSKVECSYLELYEQVTRHALLREDYYNGFIGGKIGARGLGRVSKMLVNN